MKRIVDCGLHFMASFPASHISYGARCAVMCSLVLVLCLASAGIHAQEPARMRLVFACQPDNDLYDLLSSRGGTWMRFDTPLEALRYAPNESGVLVLADEYPDLQTVVTEDDIDLAGRKNIRLFVEFPEKLLGFVILPPRPAHAERLVVESDFFGPNLPKGRILSLHDYFLTPVNIRYSHLAASRVAGYDTLAYPMPEFTDPLQPDSKIFPVLYKYPIGQVLLSSTKLSHFIRGRYAPMDAWRTMWSATLEWLSQRKITVPLWTPTVAPAYQREEGLPPDVQRQAVRRGVQWYYNAKLLVHPAWQEKAAAFAKAPDGVGPRPEPDWKTGDGTLGLLEGVVSRIDMEGYQPVRYVLRADCMSEAAMAMAFDGTLNNAAISLETAAHLVDFVLGESQLHKGPRADAKSPSYGLLGWNTTGGEGVYYGDDNARSLLGIIATAALVKADRWQAPVLRCLLANLRTTGPLGFRENRIEEERLQQAGWLHYFNSPTIQLSPHYQAYLWAAYLWGHKQTGYAPFLDRAKQAIRATMEGYPSQWRWTMGLQEERARMLLPLAWLVRVEDKPEHREWLRRVADDLVAKQEPCGAIREMLGDASIGLAIQAQSHDEYGAREMPIIQSNADNACDLLYTCNFALLGLHEAVAAGESKYEEAEKKLAQFLCKIQIRSEEHVELDGGWYRAFDFDRWEFWASDGDNGWGAWSIESGWSQAWIVSVLALRELKTSLWDLIANIPKAESAEQTIQEMMGAAAGAASGEKAEHLATGKKVVATVGYTAPFSGGGPDALADGRLAQPDLTHPAWQGYEGADLDTIIDLGASMPVKRLQTQFLQLPAKGAFFPVSVEYLVSEDGANYRSVGVVSNEVPPAAVDPAVKTFVIELPETATVRFAKVQAKNLGTIPEGLPSCGKPALLCVDEFVIQ
ncbi:MAG TPA: discoidin domain-containing protein [Candidatus Hydrogenedentes bacterium]|nr:discoidin domain-containing protein [Candidatus Hydrogenedentota bacterium]HRT20935.1 discoidin domain-containing protein [Candidatus Hydrogenedentota bacterium]HRT63458.1 discoidin domain-containing protein [Candidatus Hydrogenedentota bacterium]